MSHELTIVYGSPSIELWLVLVTHGDLPDDNRDFHAIEFHPDGIIVASEDGDGEQLMTVVPYRAVVLLVKHRRASFSLN